MWNVLRVLVNYHPYSLTKIWNRSASVASSFAANSRYKVVRFEDITDGPEQEIRAICEFLGIDFLPSILEVPQIGSSNKRNSSASAGISRDVVGTWKNTLPKGDILVCERMSAKHMADYGYTVISKRSWSWRLLAPVFRFPFHVLGAVLMNPRILVLYARSLLRRK